MRIISGIYKSRLLKTPSKSSSARPSTDRARETLFNILVNRLNFCEHICLDLFCGTGSFGIECISRGAAHCTFVDIDTKIVLQNIDILKIENGSVEKSDVLRFLKQNTKSNFSLCFADPPYSYDKYTELIEEVKNHKTLFILEHSENFIPNAELVNYIYFEKKIGITHFSFFDFT